MNKSVFIKLLEYGESVGLKGTTFDDVQRWATNENIIPAVENNDYKKQNGFLRDLFFESFVQNSDLGENWVLKVEYYFRLLEFRELQQSRDASKQANRNSMAAVIISAIAILISGFIGYRQIISPVKMDGFQLSKIISAAKQPVARNVSIDPGQLDLLLSINKSPAIINKEQFERLIQACNKPAKVIPTVTPSSQSRSNPPRPVSKPQKVPLIEY